MSLEEHERIELIRHRLDEAKESIDDVQLLIDNDRLRHVLPCLAMLVYLENS